MGTETETEKAAKAEDDSADTSADRSGTEAGTETGTETGAVADADTVDGGITETETEPGAEPEPASTPEARGATGVGQGAAAVVSAGLGVVSLTGSWLGTVAAARETLVGQLETAADSTVAVQIKEVYGDAWQTSALWGGLFALTALIVGVAVLVRPAFGTPGAAQAPWIKSVAWAGVALGAIGLLSAVLKYTDVLLGLPAAG
ncbi:MULTISPECIES: hypothetical protein [unclassified Streptomyces]|uniref:hypothetical protein n=1 Tax=unclassified Streptomyces TaxID=2593676 RepID=UPI0005A99D97|nr:MULTISPECIES: hypothetical protein [unclassified Streptomyces]ODA72412.1 hypothetical protein APS67_003335 [Streptomyces sp. AVP053U2]